MRKYKLHEWYQYSAGGAVIPEKKYVCILVNLPGVTCYKRGRSMTWSEWRGQRADHWIEWKRKMLLHHWYWVKQNCFEKFRIFSLGNAMYFLLFYFPIARRLYHLHAVQNQWCGRAWRLGLLTEGFQPFSTRNFQKRRSKWYLYVGFCIMNHRHDVAVGWNERRDNDYEVRKIKRTDDGTEKSMQIIKQI